MKFIIEQVAICPADPARAKALLSDMCSADWHEDHVTARGTVFDTAMQTNEANLSFNYDLAPGKIEFEVLDYTAGKNWMQNHDTAVSHFGMHCTAEQLVKWREFFAEREIEVAQEVITASHTNPHIKDERRYNYVIFDTRDILGADIKFIVRLDIDGNPYE